MSNRYASGPRQRHGYRVVRVPGGWAIESAKDDDYRKWEQGAFFRTEQEAEAVCRELAKQDVAEMEVERT